MKLNSMLPFRLGSSLRANLVTPIILFTFLLTTTTSRSAIASEQQHHQQQPSSHNEHNLNLQSSFDEEIILEPNHDYEKTSVDYASATQQTAHDNGNGNNSDTTSTDQRQSRVQNFDRNDPFAVTFDDYLKDTPPTKTTDSNNKSLSHRAANYDSSGSSFSSSSFTAIPDTAGLIIEDEENLVRPRESRIIDYIFPASKQEAAVADNNNNNNNSSSSSSINNNNNKDPNPIELLNEIRLLFAWKQLPTSKCSRTCGKGFRINHLSCIDLKYDVRVEDELCHKSKLVKPNETSEEPCNEIDCAPQWTSVEFQECTQSTIQDGVCRPNLYKRVQCTMVNKSGISVYLDDSKCNSSAAVTVDSVVAPNATTVTTTTETKSTISETPSQIVQPSRDEAPTKMSHSSKVSDYETVDFIIDDSLESNDKNDILSNIDFGAGSSTLSDKASKAHHPTNEPFFEPGPWSECSGAPCGELGKRTRKLSCRLHLSRSSKFAELPDSSCQNAFMPDIQEPCYLDCLPESTLSQTGGSNSGKDTSRLPSNLAYNDETVFDAEMTRFVWRKDGWTKCSAECLGGQRETIIECWDKIIESAVDQSLCDQELRPQVDVEVCNVSPCQPEWRVEEFTKCTKPCGSSGIKSRLIACVQQVPIRDGSSYMIVSNDLCFQTNGSMPHKIEPCNRIDCKPEWSVGPWSECSKKCGEGIKNRTVICVQEFANKNGPTTSDSASKYSIKRPSLDLLEALSLSAKDWHPGKVTQVPFRECYEEYRTVPALDEKCFNSCENEPYIDSEPDQNYRMTHETSKRRTVTLRVGGRALIAEGRNLKIRCRIINKQPLLRDNSLVNPNNRRINDGGGDSLVDWRKDGIQIFLNGSTMADKQYIQDDNSIFGNDVFSDEKMNQYMADQPNGDSANKKPNNNNNNNNRPATTHYHHITPTRVHSSNSRQRNLVVRSWNSNINNNNNYSGSQMQIRSQQQENYKNYHFVSQAGGRFSLVKENTLRIKRLRADDSGLYTCSYGSLSESIELKVISRSREPMDSTELGIGEEKQFGNNLGL